MVWYLYFTWVFSISNTVTSTPLQYISEANIVLLLHYNYLKTWVTRYFSDLNYDIMKHTLTTLVLFYTNMYTDVQAHNTCCELVDLLFSNLLVLLWYIKYILMPIILYFYSSKFWTLDFYFVTEYFYIAVLLLK